MILKNIFLILLLIISVIVVGILFEIYKMIHANTLMDVNERLSISIPNNVESTNKMFDLITFMINTEINAIMKSYYALNQRYEVIHIDEDVKQISTNVYEGLKQPLITDESLAVTEDYILKYINKQASLLLIGVVQTYNKTISTTT